jgi:hydroxyethylthiazole kinase
MQTISSISITPQTIYSDLQKIHAHAPLIHNLTNFVVMQYTANALLALGASPVMAHAAEEFNDILSISNALVINIGTLDAYWLHCMQQAMEIARVKRIPIIFDPVGAGASKLRTNAAQQILKNQPTVIRGNASEIMALLSDQQKTKGVDSTEFSETAIDSGLQIARQQQCITVISGANDIIVNSKGDLHRIANGVALMTRVAGMGCTATAFIAGFCAINTDYFRATAHAMAVMGIAGEIAFTKAQGPGTFQQYFLDAVYQLTMQQIAERLDVN